MKKIAMTLAAAAVSLSTVTAQAGGWGSGDGNNSKGLINVSPSIDLGNIKLLNGTSVLNDLPILSGNVVSGILNGNDIGNVGGVLSGIGINILGGNSYKLKKH